MALKECFLHSSFYLRHPGSWVKIQVPGPYYQRFRFSNSYQRPRNMYLDEFPW